MNSSRTINEAELADFVRNKAVKRLNIIQNRNGNFQLSITVTWKEGEWNLVTVRGKIREWVSLDRLVRHLKNYDGALPVITLKLNENTDETEIPKDEYQDT